MKPTKSHLKIASIRIFIALFFFSLSSVTNAQTIKVNFSGTWQLNETKSELGEIARSVRKITISQDKNELKVNKTLTRRSGEEYTTNEVYSLDGKETVNEGNRGSTTSKVSIAEDGLTLIIESVRIWERNGEKVEINTTETWSLDTGGKTLMIDYNSKSPRGERENKFVYDKQ